jgi:hypothetical protein
MAASGTALPEGLAAAVPAPGEAGFLGLLDGKDFIVEYGPVGEPSLGQDVLSFESGRFRSRGCSDLGFVPAPYWLRLEGDAIRFRAAMESPEHGYIDFTGEVVGEHIEAGSIWTRERWYRTVVLESWYRGALAAPGQALPEKS